jgi:protein-disulfide isomerase
MGVRSQRGRKVEATKRNPLTIFYIVIGAILVVGIAFLATMMLRNSSSNIAAPNAPVGRTEEGFYYKGNPAAAVTVIAYEDYQCPACAFFNQNLMPVLERDYIDTGRIQFVYHEFPLDVHPNAVPAGQAARCAGDQGKFWEMHDMLYLNQSQWAQLSTTNNVFGGYAGQLGINRADFDACVSAGTHTADVSAAGAAAIAAGAQATPSFAVNGQFVNSSGLVPAIDAALRAAGQ